LLVFQRIPLARAAALIADLTGARPSIGRISSVLTTVAGRMIDVPEGDQIADRAGARDPRRRDSSNVNGTRWWPHVASTEKLTAYHLHPSRGLNTATRQPASSNYRRSRPG
jgi:transposase